MSRQQQALELPLSLENQYLKISEHKKSPSFRYSNHQSLKSFYPYNEDNIFQTKKYQQGSQFQIRQKKHQSKMAQPDQRIQKYKHKILMLFKTIYGLQELNRQLMNQSKKNSKQFQIFTNNMMAKIVEKDKFIQSLKEQIAIFKGMIIQKEQVAKTQIQGQIYHNIKANKTNEKMIKSNKDKIMTPLNKQILTLKEQNKELLAQIKILEDQLKFKNLFIQNQKQKREKQIKQAQQNIQFYEKVINQKEEKIKKMFQFNDQICLKLLKYQHFRKDQPLLTQQKISKKNANQQLIFPQKIDKNLNILPNKNKNHLFYSTQNYKVYNSQRNLDLNCLNSQNLVESLMTQEQSDEGSVKQKDKKVLDIKKDESKQQLQKMVASLKYWKHRSKDVCQTLKINQFGKNEQQNNKNNNQKYLNRNSSLKYCRQSAITKKNSKFMNPEYQRYNQELSMQQDLINQNDNLKNSTPLLIDQLRNKIWITKGNNILREPKTSINKNLKNDKLNHPDNSSMKRQEDINLKRFSFK